MKKKYERVKEGVRVTLFWNEKKNRWQESKGKKYEAKKTIPTPQGPEVVYGYFRTMPEVNAFLQNTVEKAVPKKGMLFRELKEIWRESAEGHLFVTTLDTYLSNLRHTAFFDEMPVCQIDSHQIDRWFVHIKGPEYLKGQKSTRTSYAQEFKALRQVLMFYASRVDRGYPLPFLKDHRKKLHVRHASVTREKDLSLDEMRRFSDALREDVWDTEYEGIYFLAEIQYSEAARIQEIAPLRVEDIDFASGKITRSQRVIWRRRKGETFVKEGLKNARQQDGFSSHSLELVKEWMLRSGIRTGPLFFVDCKPLTYRMIQYRYDKALDAAGIPIKGTHLLRHAMACEYYEASKDIRATQQKLNHKDMRSTLRYVKSRAGARDKIQALMDEKLSATIPIRRVGTGGN